MGMRLVWFIWNTEENVEEVKYNEKTLRVHLKNLLKLEIRGSQYVKFSLSCFALMVKLNAWLFAESISNWDKHTFGWTHLYHLSGEKPAPCLPHAHDTSQSVQSR